jgi:hypothetical protein
MLFVVPECRTSSSRCSRTNCAITCKTTTDLSAVDLTALSASAIGVAGGASPARVRAFCRPPSFLFAAPLTSVVAGALRCVAHVRVHCIVCDCGRVRVRVCVRVSVCVCGTAACAVSASALCPFGLSLCPFAVGTADGLRRSDAMPLLFPVSVTLNNNNGPQQTDKQTNNKANEQTERANSARYVAETRSIALTRRPVPLSPSVCLSLCSSLSSSGSGIDGGGDCHAHNTAQHSTQCAARFSVCFFCLLRSRIQETDRGTRSHPHPPRHSSHATPIQAHSTGHRSPRPLSLMHRFGGAGERADRRRGGEGTGPLWPAMRVRGADGEGGREGDGAL